MTKRNGFDPGVVLPHLLALLVAAAGCVGVAIWAKSMVERMALSDVGFAMSAGGFDWTSVDADGLAVTLTGTAPDEATRFAALSAAGTVVDSTRVIDAMDVAAAAAIPVPNFSIEVLKNADEISLIGLIPLISDRDAVVARVGEIADGATVTDLLETADFPEPEGWGAALAFGIEALGDLPRSKVSITASEVAVTAVAQDAADKKALERQLNRNAPAGLALNLTISAPRPVVAPFTLRFVKDDAGVRFDACTADSEIAREAILAAAREAGVVGDVACTLGLGTPSTRWGRAAVEGILAVDKIGAGTLTLSNADIILVAPVGTSQSLFDETVGELEADLPEVFSLEAILTPTPEAEKTGDDAPPEFTAIRSPEGQVQLRGRLGDLATQAAVESFAAAQFGVENIQPATTIDDDVPAGWPLRVLTALEGLSLLHNGLAEVTEDQIVISGKTGVENAQAEITRILTSKLDARVAFALDVTYAEELDPLAAIPSPEECVGLLNEAANKKKITFAPSSADIETDAQETVDAIADILRDCQSVQIEIGGHTDSQGREVMNQQLSQARADAVLDAIMARRVLTSNLTAKGYGETAPIADNKTEDGREANRRIEFTLVLPEVIETQEETQTDDDAVQAEENQ